MSLSKINPYIDQISPNCGELKTPVSTDGQNYSELKMYYVSDTDYFDKDVNNYNTAELSHQISLNNEKIEEVTKAVRGNKENLTDDNLELVWSYDGTAGKTGTKLNTPNGPIYGVRNENMDQLVTFYNTKGEARQVTQQDRGLLLIWAGYDSTLAAGKRVLDFRQSYFIPNSNDNFGLNETEASKENWLGFQGYKIAMQLGDLYSIFGCKWAYPYNNKIDWYRDASSSMNAAPTVAKRWNLSGQSNLTNAPTLTNGKLVLMKVYIVH